MENSLRLIAAEGEYITGLTENGKLHLSLKKQESLRQPFPRCSQEISVELKILGDVKSENKKIVCMDATKIYLEHYFVSIEITTACLCGLKLYQSQSKFMKAKTLK